MNEQKIQRVSEETGISEEQLELIAASLKGMPEIKATETGVFETRMLTPTAEQIEASRRRRGLA
jgi:hypothetical protein